MATIIEQTGNEQTGNEQSGATRPVLVWDLPTRVYHAVLIVTVALGWATAQAGGDWLLVHRYNGYVLAATLLSRVVWGFAGSRHSRFGDFVRPWPAVRDYAVRLLRRDPPKAVGHSPLGGWMVVALLAVLAMLAATGLFASGGEGAAAPFARLVPQELAHGVAGMHKALFGLLLVLVTIHVLGVAAHGLFTGEHPIRAMWTGRKALPEPVARNEGATVPARWGMAVALVSGLVIWFALP